jgi:PAS domain S-box-containing protein
MKADALGKISPPELLIQAVVDYAIYLIDPDGHVASWNPGAEKIKGYTSDEIIGCHFSRFYIPEDVAAGVPTKALAVAGREGRYEAEGWRQRKDGSRFWAGVVIDAIYDDGALVGFAKVTRDLSERREAQLQLEEAREQLFQAQKMEAIGQLTGGIAHDFNNLLTGVSGSLELLQKRIAQGRIGDLERFIISAQAGVSRGAALTHRLLAFARRQTLDPQPISPNRLIVGMEELIRRSVGPAITLSTVLATDLATALCDPHQLENAILNLCINSRDAMPDGGHLTIETANTRLNEAGVEPGQYIAVSVTDTGTGMPPDVLTRAFDPFYTTKPIGQGTGLGLSMIYGFAKQSGGHARIRSKMGDGTTVCIYLPRHSGEVAEKIEVAKAPVAARARSGETILIVDDDPTVRMLITEVLEELGYGAIEVADSNSGLKVLRSDVRIDLLITDVGLPGGMNGRQMAEVGRQGRPKLPVLFITGYAEVAAIGGANLEPGMHVMTKPFAMAAMASRIKAIIAGS